VARATAPITPAPVAPLAVRGYEIISDDELIGRLADQPLLVVSRTNGTKEIRLLETPPEAGAFDE
jgi:hypothetical protein